MLLDLPTTIRETGLHSYDRFHSNDFSDKPGFTAAIAGTSRETGFHSYDRFHSNDFSDKPGFCVDRWLQWHDFSDKPGFLGQAGKMLL